jgi:glutathione-regulated potassium-efflux system ancillary protein KefC
MEESWLAGIALSTTSVAMVYAVTLEFGLDRTEYGKVVLAACFLNDLATILALGLKFSPFGQRTLVFGAISTRMIAIPLPRAVTQRPGKLSNNSTAQGKKLTQRR